MIGLLVEETDDVGALLVILETGKGHGGSRNITARIGEEFVELLEGPLAALRFHRGREVEAAALPAILADDTIKIGPDAVGTALLKGVAGLTLLGRRLALFRGCARQ